MIHTARGPEPGPVSLEARRSRALACIARSGLPVRYLGRAPVFGGTRVFRGGVSDWALLSLAEDPMLKAAGGRLIVPRRVAGEIRRLLASGVRFDAVYIAHEVPPGSADDGLGGAGGTAVPPPHPEAVGRAAADGRRATALWRLLVSAASAVTRIAAGAARRAAEVPVRSSSPADGPDPVLFGVQVAPGQPVRDGVEADWYVLSRWNWPSPFAAEPSRES